MKVFKFKKFSSTPLVERFGNTPGITIVSVAPISDYPYAWVVFYYEDSGNTTEKN